MAQCWRRFVGHVQSQVRSTWALADAPPSDVILSPGSSEDKSLQDRPSSAVLRSSIQLLSGAAFGTVLALALAFTFTFGNGVEKSMGLHPGLHPGTPEQVLAHIRRRHPTSDLGSSNSGVQERTYKLNGADLRSRAGAGHQRQSISWGSISWGVSARRTALLSQAAYFSSIVDSAVLRTSLEAEESMKRKVFSSSKVLNPSADRPSISGGDATTVGGEGALGSFYNTNTDRRDKPFGRVMNSCLRLLDMHDQMLLVMHFRLLCTAHFATRLSTSPSPPPVPSYCSFSLAPKHKEQQPMDSLKWGHLNSAPLGDHRFAWEDFSSLTQTLRLVEAALNTQCGISILEMSKGSLRRMRTKSFEKSLGRAKKSSKSEDESELGVENDPWLGTTADPLYNPELAEMLDSRGLWLTSSEEHVLLEERKNSQGRAKLSGAQHKSHEGFAERKGGYRGAQLNVAWPVWVQNVATKATPNGRGLTEHSGGAVREEEDEPAISIMVQYYKQPSIIDTVLHSYSRCTGSAPGSEAAITVPFGVELLVNVDQPGEWSQWVHQWHTLNSKHVSRQGQESRAPGFLFVVFSHNKHEIRGYNNLVRAARGDIVIMVQDDDLAPQSCAWLTRQKEEFEMRPGLACLGANTGIYHEGKRMMNPFEIDAFARDPVTGSRVNFVQWVDIGPMSLLRTAWLFIGGLDGSFGPQGQSGIISDWHISQRVWSAGFKVVVLLGHASEGLAMQGGGVIGTTRLGASLSFSYRTLNNFVNLYALELLSTETREPVKLEVSRSTLLLQVISPLYK